MPARADFRETSTHVGRWFLVVALISAPNFVSPVKTFFTGPNGYDLRTLGNATAAPAGMKVYSSRAIPGWRNSLLMTSLISGVVFRMPLTGDQRKPVV